MASEARSEAVQTTGEGQDSPVLDLTDAAVKRMIKEAKKRGFVTYEKLNEVLPSQEVSSEQIEDTMAMLSEMGINVIESEEDAEDNTVKPVTGSAVATTGTKAVAKSTRSSEPAERTDDPVRMYLREMGTGELLSREGEIAIAKRIEAGREAMIAGLCESPLTFQAIIIWRDELNESRILLRDIVDLEATYAGPEAKQFESSAANVSDDATSEEREKAELEALARPKTPTIPDPIKSNRGEGDDDDDDDDEDDLENNMSLSALEAELRPQVVEVFDKIASKTTKNYAACRINWSRTG